VKAVYTTLAVSVILAGVLVSLDCALSKQFINDFKSMDSTYASIEPDLVLAGALSGRLPKVNYFLTANTLLPADDLHQSILSILGSKLKASSLTINLIEPLNTKNYGAVISTPCNLSVTGSYRDLLKFCTAFEASSDATAITNITIHAVGPALEGGNSVTADMVVHFYKAISESKP
jgi:hypothetical protein